MNKKENVVLTQLIKSVENLTEVLNTVIDNNIHIAKELQSHKDECITLCNRINELELSIEAMNKPLVRPVVRVKRNGFNTQTGEIRTPYPKKINSLQKVYYKIRRIVNAST